MAKTKQPEESGIRVETIAESAVAQTLEVEIDAPRVKKAFDRAYRDLAKQVRVKGFRPGKAPRSILERLYGASVAEQLEQTLIGDTLGDAIELSGLEPVSEPGIEAGKPAPDAPFKYTARVEVRPAVELPDLEGLPALRPEVDVPESEVDARLERLRISHAPLVEEPEGTVVTTEHVVRVDFVGRVEGELFEGGSGQDVSIEIGAGHYLPGFEDQLIGAAPGEDREVSVQFPEDYGDASLAGKTALFAVHLVDIRRHHIPELDDEFAKDVGEFDSLDELRARVRSDLESAGERDAKQTFRTTLMDAILERTDFEVPPGMVERQLQSQLSSAHRRLEGQVEHDAIHAQLARWREEWRPRAERDVREMLVLEAIADAQSITVADEEIDTHIEGLLGDADGPAKLSELRNDEQLTAALRVQLRDDKVLDFLGAQAKVGDSSAT